MWGAQLLIATWFGITQAPVDQMKISQADVKTVLQSSAPFSNCNVAKHSLSRLIDFPQFLCAR